MALVAEWDIVLAVDTRRLDTCLSGDYRYKILDLSCLKSILMLGGTREKEGRKRGKRAGGRGLQWLNN